MKTLNDFSKAVQALKHADELVRDIALKMLQDPPVHGCRWVKGGTIETDGTEYRIEKMSISRGSDGRYYWLAYCRDSGGTRKSFNSVWIYENTTNHQTHIINHADACRAYSRETV